MPPSRKKSKWIECETCKYIINTRDMECHSQLCENIKCDETSSIPFHPLQNGFFKCGHFYGSLVSRSPKTSDECGERIVVLNGEVMRRLELNFGDHVVLTNGKGKKILRDVCAVESGPIGNVSFSSETMIESGMNEGDAIRVSTRFESIPAQKIVLKPVTNYGQINYEEAFTDYIRRFKVGCSFVTGNYLSIQYMGKEFVFEVMDIDEKKECSELSNTWLDLQVPIEDSLDTIMDESHISDVSADISLLDRTGNDSTQYTLANEVHFMKEDGTSDSIRFCSLNLKTEIILNDFKVPELIGEPRVKLDSIGGLQKQIKLISNILRLKFDRNAIPEGISNCTGIILHGPSGTGKKLVVKALANEANFHFMPIGSFYTKLYGETEEFLRKIFFDAKQNAPSIIFIEKLDIACPKLDKFNVDQELRAIAVLRSELDKIRQNNDEVIVIATAENIDAVHPDLRRPGRFHKEVKFNVPSESDRKEIIIKLLKKICHNLTIEEINSVAKETHGFVGGNLASLFRIAVNNAKIRYESASAKFDTDNERVCYLEMETKLNLQDLRFAKRFVKPGLMREVAIQTPKVNWSDIAIKEDIKNHLIRSVIWPLTKPDLYKKRGVKPPRGVLLYGPPGCSKTLIAKALATESGVNFLAVQGPELFDKYFGETEKALRDLFLRARSCAPAIIFFDEFDAFVKGRSDSVINSGQTENRLRSQLLTEIDGVQSLDGVIIVAATNLPDCIDEALLRAGRLDQPIYIPLPDADIRLKIFQIKFRTIPVSDDVDLEELVAKTENFSGAKVVQLCKNAAWEAIRKDEIVMGEVTMEHFLQALKVSQPNISDELVNKCIQYHLKQSKSCILSSAVTPLQSSFKMIKWLDTVE